MPWTSSVFHPSRLVCGLATSLASMAEGVEVRRTASTLREAEGVEVRRTASTLRFLPWHFGYGRRCGVCPGVVFVTGGSLRI
jgi:hypothetical protein